MSDKAVDLENISFEQAFQELEAIVASLENNQSSLDESMALFERGQKLAEHCAGLLEKAELKVRELNAETGSSKENE